MAESDGGTALSLGATGYGGAIAAGRRHQLRSRAGRIETAAEPLACPSCRLEFDFGDACPECDVALSSRSLAHLDEPLPTIPWDYTGHVVLVGGAAYLALRFLVGF